jgi:hypothetical protein
MNALQLFKKAGIEDYLKPGLLGAGVGAAGMGLASMFGGDDNETPSERRHRILSHLLQGAALGGATGVGLQAFNSRNAGNPSDVQAILDRAKAKGETLDTAPYGVHHPIGQLGINATHGDYTKGGVTGGILGLLKNRKLNREATSLFNENQKSFGGNPAKPVRGAGAPSGMSLEDRVKHLGTKQISKNPAVNQRLMEQALQAGNGRVDVKTIREMLERQNVHTDPTKIDALARKLHNETQRVTGNYQAPRLGAAATEALHNQRPSIANPGGGYGNQQLLGAVPKTWSNLPKRILSTFGKGLDETKPGQEFTPAYGPATSALGSSVLNGANRLGRAGNAVSGAVARQLGMQNGQSWGDGLQNLRSSAGNLAGKTTGMYGLRNAGRMVGYGGAGAAAGVGAQYLGKQLVDKMVGSGVSPEQLELWNRGGL